jgi:hypothetical protein
MHNQRADSPRSTVRAATAVVVAAIVVVVILAAPAGAAAPQLTFLTASVPHPPQPVTATDGRRHLLYEISLQSQVGVPLEMQSLTVRARGGHLLRRLTGAEIATALTTRLNGATTTLEPYLGGTIWFDVVLPRGSAVPRRLVHRFKGRAIPAAPERPLGFAFDGARTRVSAQRALSVALPLRGRRFVNVNGCCGLSPHRTGVNAVDGIPYLSQRFAIDFLPIDRRGRAFVGSISRNESFLGFRDPVYAVADGRVVGTRNDLRENTPPVEPPPLSLTPATALGNNVVVRLRGGQYVLYAHLHTGSVSVRPGQRIRTGQVLGRVGNTGESGAPHLHLQISDGPAPLASNGLPFVFRRFSLTGAVTNLDDFLAGTANAIVRPRPPATWRRRRQHPLQATVLDFPRPRALTSRLGR